MTTQSNSARAQHERGADQFSEAAKAGADKLAENGIWPVPASMEQAVRRIGEATERYNRTFGFSGEGGVRLLAQSRQHAEAMKQCGTVLTKAFEESSKTWMEMIQDQWERNRAGMDRLLQAKTVHEFGTIHGDLVRENLEHLLRDSRVIAGQSIRAAEDAAKSFAAITVPISDKKA
ncbi:hypothetical protein GCM10007884_22330 [Methylobacterium brachythecii]|nr:hypothetical protein GCM10007884_22330 [Methylobacterium brachythecii]